MDPSKHDLDKELSSGPLSEKGFSRKLRGKIEERVERKHKWNNSLTSSTGLAVLALAVVLVIRLNSAGETELTPQAFTSAMEAKPDQKPLRSAQTVQVPGERLPIHSALLLAFRSDTPDQPQTSEYRTLLIAPDKNGLSVSVQGKGILLPHGDGFWKIDALHSGGSQQIIAHPAAQKLIRQQSASPVGEVRRFTDKLLFVGNNVAALSELPEEASTGKGKPEYRVKKIEDLTEKQTLASTKQDIALGNFLKDHSMENANGQGSGDASPLWKNIDWRISRSKGKWVAEVPAAASGDSSAAFKALSVDLPESVVSYDSLVCSWEAIRSIEPRAVDAVSSPDNSWLVIVTDRELKAYAYHNGIVPQPLLNVPLKPNERLIMNQWALGNYVQDWIYHAGVYLNDK